MIKIVREKSATVDEQESTFNRIARALEKAGSEGGGFFFLDPYRPHGWSLEVLDLSFERVQEVIEETGVTNLDLSVKSD